MTPRRTTRQRIGNLCNSSQLRRIDDGIIFSGTEMHRELATTSNDIPLSMRKTILPVIRRLVGLLKVYALSLISMLSLLRRSRVHRYR